MNLNWLAKLFENVHWGKLTLAGLAGALVPILNAIAQHQRVDWQSFLFSLLSMAVSGGALLANGRLDKPQNNQENK